MAKSPDRARILVVAAWPLSWITDVPVSGPYSKRPAVPLGSKVAVLPSPLFRRQPQSCAEIEANPIEEMPFASIYSDRSKWRQMASPRSDCHLPPFIRIDPNGKISGQSSNP